MIKQLLTTLLAVLAGAVFAASVDINKATQAELEAVKGIGTGLSAKISYVSPRPEFTPPVIFSRDSRDRLVFMVEALPQKPANLMPGLPVDVEPLR